MKLPITLFAAALIGYGAQTAIASSSGVGSALLACLACCCCLDCLFRRDSPLDRGVTYTDLTERDLGIDLDLLPRSLTELADLDRRKPATMAECYSDLHLTSRRGPRARTL